MIRFLFICGIVCGVWSATAQTTARPNIIFILADDLGWSSLSCRMDRNDPASASDYHETPYLERLASAGMRFSRGYAPASICSPSRRSILLGQTPARQGDETFSANYDPFDARLRSIPQLLKAIDARYQAAHFGKWDMRADFFPEDVGYDESDGNTGNRHGDVMTDKDDKWNTHFIVDDPKRVNTLTARALNFMQRQVRAGNPFYLQVSHYATHVDLQSRRELYDKYSAKEKGRKHSNPAFAGMLEELDMSVGKIMEMVDRLGIGGETYIFFMADNGATEFLPPVRNRLDHPSAFTAPMRNHPLRGGKWTLYEGGVRVPFVVAGPGIRANSQCDVPVAGWDLLPTFGDLAGDSPGRVPGLDGGSFVNLLKNNGKGKVERPTEDLIFHRYNNSYPHSALIAGDLKVVKFWKSGKVELYDLRRDPGEERDIAGQEPQKARALGDRLMNYFREVNPALTTMYK